MKKLSHNSGYSAAGFPAGRWRDLSIKPSLAMPEIVASWIYDRSSLTQRLRDLCPQKFSVELLYQGWQRPRHDERRVLDLPEQQRAWIREVNLCCQGKPLVFARTVIPHTTLTGPRKRLMRLGRRPLGALLFAARRVRRRHFGVVSLPGDSELLARGGSFPRATIWGRRAVFYLQDKPLLVSEFFLPTLWLKMDRGNAASFGTHSIR